MGKTKKKLFPQVISAMILAGSLFLLTWGCVLYSHQIDLFEIDDIQIYGCDFIQESRIQTILTQLGPEKLTDIGVDELENELESLDYIKAAKISRIFPSILVVEIIENDPIAYVSCKDGIIVLGCHSEFLPVDKSVEKHYDLPLIVGITDSLTTETLQSDGEAILQVVLNLVHYIRMDYQSLYEWTASIEIDNSDFIFKNHRRSGTEVQCNRKGVYEQLAVLKAFEETVSGIRELDDYHYINLSLPNYVIVKEKNI